LNPQLTPTTSLNDILGTRASAQLSFLGANNDLSFQANQVGTGTNGVTVSFVNNRRSPKAMKPLPTIQPVALWYFRLPAAKPRPMTSSTH